MTRQQPFSKRAPISSPSWEVLSGDGKGKALRRFQKGHTIFAEGEPADALYRILEGRVKISRVSSQGKEAILTLAGSGDFIGERALTHSYAPQLVAANALTDCRLLRLGVGEVWRLLREDRDFSSLLLSFVLHRNNTLQEALADQIFNHSEKRLARTLLLLSGLENIQGDSAHVPKITHQTLAEMVGTTRPRISSFMSRFKSLRLIEYKRGELYVKRSLVDFVLES